MPILGAHMSIAGGYYKAVEAAAKLGMETTQIFTKNNNQWRAKPITDEDVSLFRQSIERHNLKHPCAHASYLINLGSPADELWQKSVDSYTHELERAEALGLDGVVVHPGAAMGEAEEVGLKRIVKGVKECIRRTKGMRTQVWLEATAGQGSSLGCKFEHLACILANVDRPERMGVCIDTCHIFAAGYPFVTARECEQTIAILDEIVGLEWVRAFHLNDSKKDLGTRVDRHAHIGEGKIGKGAFRWLLNDRRFKSLPMYLETKKEQRDGEEMDAVNLRVLRSLLK
jgi:deoxyribonuclease-4